MTRQLVLVVVMGLAVAFGSGVSEVHAQAAASPGASGGGPKEGIKVHGHWVIEVRNPDGTLASRHEFDNALDEFANIGGSAALAGLLGRSHTPGRWIIQLDSLLPGNIGGAPGPCASVLPCVITEDIPGVQPSTNLFRTLTMTVPTRVVAGRTVPAGTVELSGNATMTSARPITRVGTRLVVCGPTTAPSTCGADGAISSSSFAFTIRTLDTAVAVAAGQIVQITVFISFS